MKKKTIELTVEQARDKFAEDHEELILEYFKIYQ